MDHLIIGLGNSGERYAKTRHNIGAEAIKTFTTGPFRLHKKSRCLIAETTFGPHRVLLAIPAGYMNTVGGPVKALMDFYKISTGNLIVLFDDLELDFGTVQLRSTTGDHGHNGLRSLTQVVGKNYLRGGLGIGRPPGRMKVADFVLKPFSKVEQSQLPIMYADIAAEIERYFTTSAL